MTRNASTEERRNYIFGTYLYAGQSLIGSDKGAVIVLDCTRGRDNKKEVYLEHRCRCSWTSIRTFAYRNVHPNRHRALVLSSYRRCCSVCDLIITTAFRRANIGDTLTENVAIEYLVDEVEASGT